MRSTIKKHVKNSNLGQFLFLQYHKARAKYLKGLTDEEFAKRVYKKAGLGELNLDSPQTFDEKIWWLKINYRDPLMVDCTDKVKVRDYVNEVRLGHILNDIYGVYNSPEDIEWEKLPNKFYIKTNHSSATNIYIENKEKVNKKELNKRLSLYLKKEHYPLSREWNYKDIVPKILIEKVLNNNEDVVDYKFLCSYGEMQGLFIYTTESSNEKGRHNTKRKRNVYDKNFNILDVEINQNNFNSSNDIFPDNIEKMKEYAEILSEPFPFSRIDLYNIDGEIIFGEITFFHTGGLNRIDPEKYQKILGSWITLPQER